MNNKRGPYMGYNIRLDVQMPKSTQRDRERRLQQQEAPGADNVEDDDAHSDRSRSSLGSEHSYDSEEQAGSGDSNDSAAESEDNIDWVPDDSSDGDEEIQSENGDSEDGNNSEEDSDISSEDSNDDEEDPQPDDPDGDPGPHPDVDPDEDPEEERPRIPIYLNCPISREEGALLIMTFALRFGLSDLAIGHLLKIIDLHMPAGYAYGSFHTFMQATREPPPILREYYCPQKQCQLLARFVGEAQIWNCECGYECVRATLDKQQSYFLSMPLTIQLIRLFEDRELFESLRWEDRHQSDVVNGQFYKTRLRNQTIREGRDLTLQFNTDGVQVFKSSKVQMWPIQVSINELPYKLRKDNILLCGLWYGGKPNMNTFLSPFINELNILHRHGFVLPGEEPQLVRVHTILSTVDSMARPCMQGLKTHSGFYGCPFCLHRGQDIMVGAARYHLYPGNRRRARTQAQHIRDTRTYFERPRPRWFSVRGVHGAAELLRLDVFRIIDSFVPDYLHAVLLGVVKTMVCEYWTKSCRDDPKPYYLNPAKLVDFNTAICTIKVPSEITRSPRPFDEKKMWRGHEWKNFLLYYSLVCLLKLNFPARYVNHWFLLVYSMSIFLSDQIDEESLVRATGALQKYVLTVAEVYETPFIMKFNTHLLLHIPKSVRDFGGLWAWSTFSYEHYNGILAKMYRSSQAAHLQICKNYLRVQGLKSRTPEIINNIATPLYVRKALNSLEGRRSSKHAFIANRNLTLIGAPKLRQLTCQQLHLIQNLIGVNIKNYGVMFYERFIYKNALHHVESYEGLKKRLNSVVRLIENEFISITHVIKVETDEINPRRLCVLLGCNLEPTGDHLCVDRELGINSDKFVTIVERTQECVAITPHMIERKCVFTFHPKDDEKFCCFPLPNVLERD